MMIDLLIKCFLLQATTLDDAKRISNEMARMILKGGLARGDEFNVLCECSPLVIQMMAHGLGINKIGLLRNQIHDGNITSDDLIQGFKKSENKIDNLYARFKPSCFGIRKHEYIRAMSMLIGVEALKQ